MLKERIRQWRHVFKLDPNRALPDRALERICLSGTDAIVIGGTDGITSQNTRELLDRVEEYPVECVQEVSHPDAVIPGLEGYLIPSVLNAGSLEWVLGAQHQALKRYGEWIPWEDIAVLGYVVLNPKSRVGRLTKCKTDLNEGDLTAYGRLVEHLFQMPALYVEYSGVFGDKALVEAGRLGVSQTRLFYGGGIAKEEDARTMAAIADTVIVGNLVYLNVDAAVKTVQWVKGTEKSYRHR